MTTYVLLDSLNLFHRSKHQASKQYDTWTKLGYSIHVLLSSINKVARDFNADHIVICTEGRSWRKDFHPPYKYNRKVARDSRTPIQVEEDNEFDVAYRDLIAFFSEKTSCSVLHSKIAEADDLIARWIALHPDDDHVIVSTDSDFQQLIKPNVRLYNGVTNELWTVDGIFNDKNKPVIDKKTKEQKTVADPEWLLFEKCIRGDSSDNVFSAYPGAYLKSTKNRIGIIEAFEDRNRQGYAWNNFMLQTWTDHEDEIHKVCDDYKRNVTLIDLNAQPQDIKDRIDSDILNTLKLDPPSKVGIWFMKFCGKYELNRISENAQTYVEWLKSPYQGPLIKDANE